MRYIVQYNQSGTFQRAYHLSIMRCFQEEKNLSETSLHCESCDLEQQKANSPHTQTLSCLLAACLEDIPCITLVVVTSLQRRPHGKFPQIRELTFQLFHTWHKQRKGKRGDPWVAIATCILTFALRLIRHLVRLFERAARTGGGVGLHRRLFHGFVSQLLQLQPHCFFVPVRTGTGGQRSGQRSS